MLCFLFSQWPEMIDGIISILPMRSPKLHRLFYLLELMVSGYWDSLASALSMFFHGPVVCVFHPQPLEQWKNGKYYFSSLDGIDRKGIVLIERSKGETLKRYWQSKESCLFFGQPAVLPCLPRGLETGSESRSPERTNTYVVGCSRFSDGWCAYSCSQRTISYIDTLNSTRDLLLVHGS